MVFHIGYIDHFAKLKGKHLGVKVPDFLNWTLKEYGYLFVLDSLLEENKIQKVLEIGPGFNTFFSDYLPESIEYWYLDKRDSSAGILTNSSKWEAVDIKRQKRSCNLVETFLGDFSQDIPSEYFDAIISVSVLEHIPDSVSIKKAVLDGHRILRKGGLSIHSIDIYPSSNKADLWYGHSKQNGFVIPQPYRQTWDLKGKYTTFIENAEHRYLYHIGNSKKFDSIKPYSCHFATMLFSGYKQ